MKTVASKLDIAKYWIERGTFDNLLWDSPGCFACGNDTGMIFKTPETGWASIRLDRAHLIPVRSNGANDASNIVLLCKRCHADAPMIGTSQKPMIDWINRRESHIVFMLRSVMQECISIDKDLLGRLAVSYPGFQLYDRLKAAHKALDAWTHPGGTGISTVAALLKGIGDFTVAPEGVEIPSTEEFLSKLIS